MHTPHMSSQWQESVVTGMKAANFIWQAFRLFVVELRFDLQCLFLFQEIN
jgi:hypothetical protein